MLKILPGETNNNIVIPGLKKFYGVRAENKEALLNWADKFIKQNHGPDDKGYYLVIKMPCGNSFFFENREDIPDEGYPTCVCDDPSHIPLFFEN
jgi:hypothetical protein